MNYRTLAIGSGTTPRRAEGREENGSDNNPRSEGASFAITHERALHTRAFIRLGHSLRDEMIGSGWRGLMKLLRATLLLLLQPGNGGTTDQNLVRFRSILFMNELSYGATSFECLFDYTHRNALDYYFCLPRCLTVIELFNKFLLFFSKMV